MAQNQPLLIDFMLRHAWHRVSRMYNNTARTEGMTMSVGFILMIVEKKWYTKHTTWPQNGYGANIPIENAEQYGNKWID